MTLNDFCKDSWIPVKDGEKTYRKSRHCYEKEIDLYRAIARWQFDQVEKKLHKIETEAADDEKEEKKLKLIKLYLIKKKACLIKQFQESGESTAFSSWENENFMKCLICGIGRNRAVWREIKSFFYCHRSRNNWNDGLSECFNILAEINLFYLLSFDLEKVRERDNENVMNLLAGYIAKCVYPREILKIYIGRGFGEIGDDYEPEGSVLLIDPAVFEKISDYMFSLLEKASRENMSYAFVHESLSARKSKSDLARKHKNRLREYILECLTKEEHEILEPSHAAMITDYIEESLGEGEECRIVICLKNEHKTAVQRITSLFEEARKQLKLDNFIAENKACIDKRSRSSFFKYEEAELIKFIRERLNRITENVDYFKDVTPKYIADEIGRMIYEKEISV